MNCRLCRLSYSKKNYYGRMCRLLKMNKSNSQYCKLYIMNLNLGNIHRNKLSNSLITHHYRFYRMHRRVRILIFQVQSINNIRQDSLKYNQTISNIMNLDKLNIVWMKSNKQHNLRHITSKLILNSLQNNSNSLQDMQISKISNK